MKPTKIIRILPLFACLTFFPTARAAEEAESSRNPRAFKLFAYRSALLKKGARELTPELINYLAEIGYNGVEIGLYDAKKLAETLEMMKAAGIEPVCAYSMAKVKPDGSVTVHTPGPDVAELLRDRGFVLWVATCHAGQIPEGVDDARIEASFIDTIRAAADKLAPYGIDIALYNHRGHWRERVVENYELAKKVDRPNVGITFNLFHHLDSQGEGPDTVEPTLRKVASMVRIVAVNGVRTEGRRLADYMLPLDEGDYDLKALFALLEEVGYTGYVGTYGVPGMEPEEALKRNAEAWKTLIEH